MSKLSERSENETKTSHPGDESSGVILIDRNSVYFHVILKSFQWIPQVSTDDELSDDERLVRK